MLKIKIKKRIYKKFGPTFISKDRMISMMNEWIYYEIKIQIAFHYLSNKVYVLHVSIAIHCVRQLATSDRGNVVNRNELPWFFCKE
ncbi:hypothetical protein RCL_jg23469.t1 [Rhizophagus clarus]|uniref:Uncharacterized protein n=1 Tax=Rhizophagus clarus TaxID=94130 RepID=A0A8H3QG92_9GLOM|nr:hypothetical protein RCL_jg23469.t1 [Rhizophagus clarus]